MGPWDFQASTDSLGLTVEEEAAAYNGDAPTDQLIVRVQMARNALVLAEAGNPMSRPS
jgi:hypothetical protein